MATLRWTDDCADDRTVVAYEPVRRPVAAVQRRRPGRLRIFKARLTLSFSIYVISGGTLLTVGTFLLSGILFLVGFLALGFSACVAATWLCFNKAINLATAASKKLLPKPSTTSSLLAPPPPPPLPSSNGGLQHVD